MGKVVHSVKRALYIITTAYIMVQIRSKFNNKPLPSQEIGQGKCPGSSSASLPFDVNSVAFVVIVSSKLGDQESRSWIRNTWGDPEKSLFAHGRKILFVVGSNGTSTQRYALNQYKLSNLIFDTKASREFLSCYT